MPSLENTVCRFAVLSAVSMLAFISNAATYCDWKGADGGGVLDCDFSENTTLHGYAHEYVKLCADNFPYNEYRCGYRTGGMPVMQRLHDQKHSWDAHGKVNSCMLAAGLLGSPYIVADMIGGGRGGTFRPG